MVKKKLTKIEYISKIEFSKKSGIQILSTLPIYNTIIFFCPASRNYRQDAPPPYTPPAGPWYAAPPPAYTPNPNGYMGWVPPTNVFPDQPPGQLRRRGRCQQGQQSLTGMVVLRHPDGTF